MPDFSGIDSLRLRWNRFVSGSCTFFASAESPTKRRTNVGSVKGSSWCFPDFGSSKKVIPTRSVHHRCGTTEKTAMPLCCCRRRTPNRVEEAEDKRAQNQETLHYTHRDGVVTVTREYSHPSLRGTVTQRTYKSMDDVRLDSRQAASQLAQALPPRRIGISRGFYAMCKIAKSVLRAT
jgi:hypothetical protein